ncbi:MAG TPA: hypothetical protein VEQ40_13890, partial [Pyrinomonadaceae bacterium]|nr:hypothetical protein [Pyrinomonadaceae bacterium]
MKLLVAIICALFFAVAPVRAQEQAQAFVGAQIIPISGPVIMDGVLVVQKGKIVSVGARDRTTIPAGAQVRQVAGMVIMPDLVDSHRHIGGGSGGDQS